MEKDWRLLNGQEEYLHGIALIHHSYRPADSTNDHDHCEFCMDKFSAADGDLKYGYSTADNKIWICPECYEDFKDSFAWTVTEGKN